MRLVRATRPDDGLAPDAVKKWVSWGAGPRASQSLGVKLRRVLEVNGEGQQQIDRWDFNFQGIALLPRGTQSSGSAD